MVIPAVIPVTLPVEEPMEPTEGVDELQAPLTTESYSITDAPAHNIDVPIMFPGDKFTVIVFER